jgi:predicted transcriptional regulator
MATVTINIPDDKVKLVMDAMWFLYPCPVNEDGTYQYKKAQWAKESVVRLIRRDVHRYMVRQAQIDAEQGIVKDDTVAG